MPRFCLSDKGRVRERNEDSVTRFTLRGATGLVVADGLGGHPAGHIASETAAETFAESFQRVFDDEVSEEVLRICFEDANDAVRSQALENPEYEGMGTTLVAALIQDGRALIGNVGDSRAYLISDDSIEQVTEDQVERIHSGVGGSRTSTIIAQAVGLEDEIYPDFHRVNVEDNVLLLCSDGLTSELSSSRIQKIVAGNRRLKVAARKLVEYANERGGQDNISVCLYTTG